MKEIIDNIFAGKYNLLIIGIGFIVIGLGALYRFIYERLKPYTVEDGSIVEFRRTVTHHTRGPAYYGFVPIFEFTYEGKTYQVEHRMSGGKYGKDMEIVPRSKYHIGDKVKVRVYADKPENAIIESKGNLRMPIIAGAICLIVGSVFTALYFVILNS